jgi:hypothetical protein
MTIADSPSYRPTHSPDIDLWLQYGGCDIPLAEIGPGFVRSHVPRRLPPGRALLFTSIDGVVRQREVYLDEGMSDQPGRTEISDPNDPIPF